MTITTQAVREMAERLGVLAFDKSMPTKVIQAVASASDMLLALVEERDSLYARLEMVEAYDGEGNRISVEPYSIPDGIEARNATIQLLDNRVKDLSARAEAAETALRETLAALEPFTTPPLYVLEGEARFVPEKMPDGWIGGGWFSSDDFRRAITTYHRTSRVVSAAPNNSRIKTAKKMARRAGKESVIDWEKIKIVIEANKKRNTNV